MNWKEAAIEDLRAYGDRKQSLINIRERIEALSAQAEAARTSDPSRVGRGGADLQDRLIGSLAERERLKYTYRAAEKLVRLVERGLSSLDSRERQLLEGFYICRAPGHAESLMDSLCCEKAQIYRLKDEALTKFTRSMYGLSEY